MWVCVYIYVCMYTNIHLLFSDFDGTLMVMPEKILEEEKYTSI